MRQHLNELQDSISKTISMQESILKQITDLCEGVINNDGTIFIAGNGGSYAQAQHFAAELVVRIVPGSTRRALPAIALMSDGASLTACANDIDFNYIYSRSIEAIASSSDLVILLSTSGESSNLIEAAKSSLKKKMTLVSFTGQPPNQLSDICDHNIFAFSSNTAIIQESHLFFLHELALSIDSRF